MKHILLFGAGKSSTFLIQYLKELAEMHRYTVTVADEILENAQAKVGEHPFVKPVKVDVKDKNERRNLIQNAHIVISLLPPSLHYLVAEECLELAVHLLTASYQDEKVRALTKQVEAKNLLFLCEMGLDPGIDHMSAMHLINRIKAAGGKITSFRSHCGGLVAPENDTNPWHYKISWNPRNVVLAGKAGAIFKEKGEIKQVQYEQIFSSRNIVDINEELQLSYYPNRNSISYIPIYNLEEAETFIRTTLRHPDFVFGWKNIVDLKLTDEAVSYDTTNMTFAEFFRSHFEKSGLSNWLHKMLITRLSFAKDMLENLVQLLEAKHDPQTGEAKADDTVMLVNEHGELDTVEAIDLKGRAAATLAAKMQEANLVLKQLFFLGLASKELINRGNCTAAEVLQFIIEKKMALQPNDKDMVVMMHEIEYEANREHHKVKSTLLIRGENSTHTAMAKTVGLPLGIAAKLILEGGLRLTGVHIPAIPSIYDPVLQELRKHGIGFEEKLE